MEIHATLMTWCLLGLTIAQMRSTAHMYKRASTVRIEPAGSAEVPNSIACAAQLNRALTPFGAVQLGKDGNGCDVVSSTWLQDRVYDDDFVYLVQERIDPPICVYCNPLFLNFPGFVNDSSVSVVLSASIFNQDFEMHFKDETQREDILSVTILGSEKTTKVRSSIYVRRPPFPFEDLNASYTIKFDVLRATNQNFRIAINGVVWLSISTNVNRLPSDIKYFAIMLTNASEVPLFFHQFVFDSA